MGHMLAALLALQKIESKLAQVRSRLRTRERAVKVQQIKIDQLSRQWQELHDRHLAKRLHADELALIVQERDEQVAKLSIVGVGMRSHSGVAARMFKALADAGVNIESISTSEIKISCLIRETDVEKATKAVHAEFDLAKRD